MDLRSFIVLDLDETLIHAPEAHCTKRGLLTQSGSDNRICESSPLNLSSRVHQLNFKEGDTMTVIERPFLQQFLEDVFNYFDSIIVWTAGKEHYAKAVVDAIFRSKKPDIIYNWSHCRKQKDGYDKPLRYLVEDPKIKANLQRMVIVDDRPENMEDNPDNGIIIPPFLPYNNQEGVDYTLPVLSDWLQKLSGMSDFRGKFTPEVLEEDHYLSEFF